MKCQPKKYVSCKEKELQKEKNGREEFKDLNIEAVSERRFE